MPNAFNFQYFSLLSCSKSYLQKMKIRILNGLLEKCFVVKRNAFLITSTLYSKYWFKPKIPKERYFFFFFQKRNKFIFSVNYFLSIWTIPDLLFLKIYFQYIPYNRRFDLSKYHPIWCSWILPFFFFLVPLWMHL